MQKEKYTVWDIWSYNNFIYMVIEVISKKKSKLKLVWSKIKLD